MFMKHIACIIVCDLSYFVMFLVMVSDPLEFVVEKYLQQNNGSHILVYY